MKYIIEYQTQIRVEVTELEAKNENFARAAFYEIYNRTIEIIKISQKLSQAA